MKCRKLLAGGIMLSVLTLGHWHQAMASDYLGQFCLVLKPGTEYEEILEVGLDKMGNDHITVAGTLETDKTYPVGGNVELIGENWRMSLLSTWKYQHDIYHLKIETKTLKGKFWRTGRTYNDDSKEFDSSYDSGEVRGFRCAVVKPGTECDGLQIPPGHLPPPGSCRIWSPGVPPGHQGPPGACSVKVPEGTCLIDQYGIVRTIGG